MKANGLTEEALEARSPAKIFGPSFVLCLIAAWVFALFWINGGYHTVQLTLMGAILGLWPA